MTVRTATTQPEVRQPQYAAVRKAFGFNGFGGASGPVDHCRDADDLRAGLQHRSHRGQRRPTGRAGVLDDQDPLTGDVGPFDKSLHAMAFHGFPDHESVDWATRCVHDGGGDRVGAQRESADRGVIPVRGELADQPADQGGSAMVQRGPTQVDVIVGFLARRQCDAAVHHRQFAYQIG